jgi:hypothetical protein
MQGEGGKGPHMTQCVKAGIRLRMHICADALLRRWMHLA